GGDVWTVTKGVIAGGTVIVKGAKVEQVGGPEVRVPEGATVVHATGKVVAPGFVTTLASNAFGGGGLITPGDGRVRELLDPFALAVPLALATGVTTAYVESSSRGFGGGAGLPGGAGGLAENNAILKMAEGDLTAMLMREPAMVTFTVGNEGGGGPGASA